MSVSEELLNILACPQDLGDLWYFQDEAVLYNPRMKVKYMVKLEIPSLLPEEAISVDEIDHARYCDRAKSENPDVDFDIDPYTKLIKKENQK
jgi:uncharacterized protein YbaR (Trm112 family)